MRKTTPAFAMSAMALALAAFYTPAQAAGGGVIANPGRTMVAPRTSTPPAQSGSGGTVTQNSSSFSPSAPNPTSAQTITTPAPAPSSNGVTATGPAATNISSNPNSTNANPDPFGPGSTFANDNGNPELGQSPGQSSSGTLSGNSSNGIGTGTETLGNPGGVGVTTNNGTNIANGSLGTSVLPADMVGGGGVAYGVATPGYSSTVNTTVAIPATTATPLLNQVTRTEIEKEARQRAQGRTPQVIGIAPRTNVDRTNQMPDDPIIRY